MPINPH